jgi:teichuronic acid biosynthesis glycosyltransferase TuaC
MRVLFVTSMHPTAANPQRGIIVARLAQALRGLGHEIEFFRLGHDGGPLRYLRARPNVAAMVRTYAPSVVHVHFGYSGLAVPALDVPIVTSFYGDDLNGTWVAGRTTWRSRVGVLISQLVALRSNRCVIVSEALRERLWFPTVRRKTVVVRDAVDPLLFRPYPRDAARARLGLERGEVLILFPHDVTQATKRLGLAQAAVAQLRMSEPRARLWVVNGQAPDQMAWYYSASDVMIITSASESGPSSAKEALACGLPVVGVPVGDLQLFEDVPEMMIRADATPDSLAHALNRALTISSEPRRSHLPSELSLSSAARCIEEAYLAACVS